MFVFKYTTEHWIWIYIHCACVFEHPLRTGLIHHVIALQAAARASWNRPLHLVSPATMSFLFSVLVLMLMGLAACSVGPNNSSSSYCTESKECLQFDLICRTDQYEVRHYSATRWISTDAEAYFLGVGAAMAFRRLYHYISGDNTEGVKFEMTAPILVEVPEETKMWEPAIYTLSFLLPSAYQENPPIPTNDKLYFSNMPDMDVYVGIYGGWMLSITSRLHAHLLSKALLKVNAHYNHTHHFAVGYDSPLKLLNRHNEVWYVVEGDPVCGEDHHPSITDIN